MSPPPSIPDLLRRRLAEDSARPLITQLGADGSRTELSVRTFENNAAKAANLLRDDADLPPGGVVVLRLPLHWQTSVWLGAVALVGGVAWIDGDPADPSAEVSVVGPDGLDDDRAPLALATALHPLGMPFAAPLPAGLLDSAVEVRMHGDVFVPGPVDTEGPWIRTHEAARSQHETIEGALSLGAAFGIRPGSRVLCARPAHDDLGSLALLALPLACDAAVVLADAGADLDAVAAAERCDVVLA